MKKIGVGEIPDLVNAIIEIPYGSNIKYEIDKESEILTVDRVMYSAMFYPANYGFIPNTLAEDGDPVDILVLTNYPIQAGSLIKCKLIGVLNMEDEAGNDEKLIAVPTSKIDPSFSNVNSLKDIAEADLNKIKNFFETYKMLEPNKWVKVKSFEDKKSAEKILKKALEK